MGGIGGIEGAGGVDVGVHGRAGAPAAVARLDVGVDQSDVALNSEILVPARDAVLEAGPTAIVATRSPATTAS